MWSAPGKVFLFGEHAVVYGKPGIAMAIKPRVFVTVRDTKRPQRAKSPYIDSCFEAMEVMGSVYINSQIPSSSGLGSSAAVTVATLSAINDEFRLNKTREDIANMAFEIPVVEVRDPLLALGKLAGWYRDQFTIPFVAVTGSTMFG